MLRTKWSRAEPTPEAQGLSACRKAPSLQVFLIIFVVRESTSQLEGLPTLMYELLELVPTRE